MLLTKLNLRPEQEAACLQLFLWPPSTGFVGPWTAELRCSIPEELHFASMSPKQGLSLSAAMHIVAGEREPFFFFFRFTSCLCNLDTSELTHGTCTPLSGTAWHFNTCFTVCRNWLRVTHICSLRHTSSLCVENTQNHFYTSCFKFFKSLILNS